MSLVRDRLALLVDPSSLLTAWGALKNVPGGGRLLGVLIGRVAPYTGTIHPEIVALERGFSKVRMADRPQVRNHLQSVHAIALLNLGEVATGTAMLVSVPPRTRAIITHLEMDYLKKARGPITAECTAPVLTSNARAEHEVHAELKNVDGVVVARAHARWLVGPAR